MPKEDKRTTAGEPPGDDWRSWADCVAALGSDRFAERLLSAVDGVVVADHLSFFRLIPGTPPALVGAESRVGSTVATNAGQRYVKSLYYRFDPNTRRLRAGRDAGDDPLVTRLLATDITDTAYRREIYERFGLEDRLSIMGHEGAVWHIVSLYRDRATGRFSHPDEAALAARAPLISQLAARQLATTAVGGWAGPTLPPVALLERMVRDLGAGLSEREAQVCARALLGKTGEGIALDLDVKETTVATLRKRAYAKLGITTLNELFALCLSREAGARPIAL